MKDFILDEVQIDCAARMGAAAVLLIAALHPAERLATLVDHAHAQGREVLLEVASAPEYAWAMGSRADAVGINNRDLGTFAVDIARTLTIAKGAPKTRPVVSMSGLRGRGDLDRVSSVADAFLVGSSLLDGTTTLEELLRA
jgi:indole-3-glycerol phosphate synthase